jgi:hypothetical protein
MNAMVMDATDSINNWIASMVAKVNRAINKIGYHRAATELARMGYTKEAQKCLDMLKTL